MKEFNKVRYIPLKYQNEIRSVSNPKQSGLNLNSSNKFQGVQPLKNINFNNYNFVKNNYLNYHYNNTEINNTNTNDAQNINQFINKTQNNYYTNKYKERIINDIKNNFNKDNKKKKNFYLNVNFNLNQNYTIPNISNNKINRSLSVQNYYENKNNINNINNKINLYENSYNNSIFNNNNYKKNKATNSFKSIYENGNNYLNNRNNTEVNNANKNNKSYTKILNNKSLEFQSQNKNYISNVTNKQNSNKNFVYHKSNNININNKNFKNIKILYEPKNNIIDNNNIQHKPENNNDQMILNLEMKMKNLLKENKTDSKGRNYNIIRKIFEEAINILNFTKNEKKFLKLILLKYHEIVFAFSQENKLLKQSSENLQNMNFSLDKKYLDLEKNYKIILKENQDMKNILSIKNNDEINFNENNIINVDQNKNNINEDMMYRSIKDMDFELNESCKKEEKYENDNELFENDIKIKNIENKIDQINLINKANDSNRAKSENIKKRRQEFNKLNLNDLDSLYFNDKINNIHCYNSKKNYDKVPKIKFLNKCKL